MKHLNTPFLWQGCLGLCLLLWAGWGPAVHAQKNLLRSEFFSVDEGLPDRQVTSLLRDADGFLWTGTPNGLARFDGYEFLTFNDHPDNPYRISFSSVEDIHLDRDSNLVVFYDNIKYQFDLLDPHTHEAQAISTNFAGTNINGETRAFHVDREGDIYVLTVQTELGAFLYRYEHDSTAFSLVFHLEDLQTLGSSVDMVRLADGGLLLNDSRAGLRLFDAGGRLLRTYARDLQAMFPSMTSRSAHANFMHRDLHGDVWLSLANVPAVLKVGAETAELSLVTGLPFRRSYNKIWEDRQGNLLIADSEITSSLYYDTKALFCIEPDGTQHDFSQLTEISNRILTVDGFNFFKTIYLGHESGLSIVQNNRPKVTTYLTESVRSYRRGARMRGVVSDGNGLVYFAKESGAWYVLDHDINYLEQLDLVDRQTGEPIPMTYALDLALDSLGYLWGISHGADGLGQLLRLDTEDCLTDRYPSEYQFTAMRQARNGHFWLGGQQGQDGGALVLFDTSKQVFNRILDDQGVNPLRNATIIYLLESRNGTLWIGTTYGLFSYDPESRTWRRYRHDYLSEEQTLSSNTIYVIHEAEDGRLWLGTREGVNVFDPDKEQVQIIDKRNGLADNNVCGILPDGQGNYWFSTYNGLSYYEPDQAQARNFFSSDGFSHDEFNRFSFARDPYNDRIYLGGMNGMNAFYQDVLLDSDPPPPVVLTRLTRYNARQNELLSECSMLCDTDEVVISPYDIYFQFHFMLPNYTSPHRNQFAAWLEGYEDQWIKLGTTPNIRYSKLPAGSYTLHINGADPNGNWSPKPISIPIRVKPVFYKTWWFMVLVSLTVTGLLYAWMQYRLEQKLKVERLRTKISSDLHDEVSGLLGGIAMQTDLLQEMVDNFESRHKLAHIGSKIRKAMSKMSDVIWSIDSRNDKVDDLLLRMHEHAEEVLSGLDVTYEFHIGNLDRQVKMPVKVRQELYFIFKEAINNIAKHSNASRVDIHIGNQGQLFEMTVHDNGFSQTKTGPAKTGQGLSNIRMRAQRIKANLDILNGDGYTINLSMKKFA